MNTGNTRLMRKINIGILRTIMKQQRIFKKAELAEASGLSVVTINSLLDELIERGEVFETDNLAATGGRRAALYEYNAGYQLILTMCLYERNKQEVIHVSISNLFGESIFEKESIFAVIRSSELECLIEECLEKHKTISLITIGIPGQEITGSLQIMDFKGLQGERLSDILEQEFDIPVLIENDINVAISGYCLDLDGGDKSIVGIYYPMNNPPGAGIILNGALLKGKNGMVGEIKYLPFGIEWKHFSFQKEDVQQHAIKTAIAIGSLYDPDEYVFYGEMFDDDFIREVEKELSDTFSHIEVPHIVLETNFHQHYLRGAVAISLDYLSRQD